MNFRLPWAKPETRQSYTELVLNHAIALASGEVVSGLSSIFETCAGWWGRAFEAATIEPDGVVKDLLEIHLGLIGRSLLLTGEIVFLIDTSGERLTLVPAKAVDISGGANPATWEYMLELAGPSLTTTRIVGPEQVLHLTYATAKGEPWRGISPILASATTRTLLTTMEQRLTEEVSGGTGQLIPVPSAEAAETLQEQLRNLKGKLALVETTELNWGSGATGSPNNELLPRRLGGNPPVSTIQLRRQVEESILSAAGVPPSALGGASESGTKESLRLFTFLTIDPILKALALTIAHRFDIPGLHFDLRRLRAADIQARSRSVAALVAAGYSLEEAAKVAMLLDE